MNGAASVAGWRIGWLLWVCAAACGADPVEAGDPDGERTSAARPPGQTGELLDDLGLFRDAVAQEPAAGVVPYDVTSVLYADEVEKLRFLALPPGQAAEYDPVEMWRYPEGTRFIKTFYVPLDARAPRDGQRLIETRIIE